MDDLKKIKREYGENMAHLCRELFPTLLEIPSLLYIVLKEKFYPSRFLYDDIVSKGRKQTFISIIMSAARKYLEANEEEDNQEVQKTPKELLDEAGYILYECKTEKDVQSFRHYYKRNDGKTIPEYVEGTTPIPWEGEELCTFNGGRLNRCHIFFAVKKNVDEIKREDFTRPERQDEYGTSVLSIQFERGESNIISIKNRYNHAISGLNPDATFSNDLDNIIPGLTRAFEREYGLNIKGSQRSGELPGYVLASDGRFYKYNLEIHGVYYCPDNVIIDHIETHELDKSRYIVMDEFILDMQEKTIKQFNTDYVKDAFVRGFWDKLDSGEEISTIRSVKVEVDKETKEKKITINGDIIIILTPTNEIKYYKNPHIRQIGNRFLINNKKMEEIDLPNAKIIGDMFMPYAYNIKRINLPSATHIGASFLLNNYDLEEIDLPECNNISIEFLPFNKKIRRINLPKVDHIGGSFLANNEEVEEIDLPLCRQIGHRFLGMNKKITKLNIPNIRKIGDDFLGNADKIEEIDFPRLYSVGRYFMRTASKIKKVNLPNLETAGLNFLATCCELEELDLPSLESIDSGFLIQNTILKRINLPKCREIKDGFLQGNTELEEINLPNVETIGNYFLTYNYKLKKINISKCKTVGSHFLEKNEALKEIDLSNLEEINGSSYETEMNYIYSDFLKNNRSVKLIRDNKKSERRK